ncbi:MAG TPA: adenosine-specific kinase [Vicinamibacterales bacterium]|nr:adenosine-specific kinase [Vicinamibacterales bacterium]HOG27982.1 adenosine-specific kinase [Vicinamibacterales bacterium]HOQ60885.1 adenosine-specific kinase [Vicinamibacterales bacterium]HPW21192.1 adenosine-specific kinase [Vicinamibacterales bacterium]
MDLQLVPVAMPENANVVIGQSHFIKTVEDLYEIMATTVPGAAFGLAFNEASGACLVRSDGNDEELRAAAVDAALALGAGHTFVLYMRGAYPINVLNRIKDCQEVCRVFCATANPLQAVVAESDQGRGIVGVIDGSSPKGVEAEADREWRAGFLRRIGYKR